MKSTSVNIRLIGLSLAILLSLSLVAVAQTPQVVKPEARAALDEGKAAQKKGDLAAALAAYRRAIELDPSFVEAHESYYGTGSQAALAEARKGGSNSDDAIGKAMDEFKGRMMTTYTEWSVKYPNVAAVQWQLGELYMYKDYDKVEAYAKKALAIDPKFTRAYQTLSLIAEAAGDEKTRLENLAMAAKSAPDDPSPLFYYASALRKSNPELNRQKSLELVEKFPNSERGAQALYWLGFEAEKLDQRIAYLEKLRATYPPAKFNWSQSGMSLLFDNYSRTSPDKALVLAQEMAAMLTGSEQKSWQANATYQENLNKSRALLDAKKYDEALTLLKATTSPRYFDTTSFTILKAEATAGVSGAQLAYDDLVKVMAEKPTEVLRLELAKLATKIGKTNAQVDDDVWKVAEMKAALAKDFSFPRYPDEKKLSLADYRGKVVLLNMWYPFCGPCRGEAPYLQKVLKKYGPDKFVILAVNVHPEEDKFVMPYIKGNKYDFVPIRGSQEWATRDYQARGMPSNFLIDQQGRIIYKPGVIRGADSQRTLELQVESILSQTGKVQKTADATK